MPEQHSICLAYVHPGFVRAEFMDSVLRMLGDGRYLVSMVQVESGTNVQKARNDCVRWFMANAAAEHLFFVDTDMVWSPDVPAQLIAADRPIVSALYLGRGADGKAFPVGMAWDSEPDKTMRYLKLTDLDGLTEVAGVGMGCAMIRREVIEALGEDGHPDQWPFAQGQTRSASGGFLSMSEDITFCVRAHNVGHRSYIAADVGVGHVKSFILSPPSNGSSVLRGQPEHMAAFSTPMPERA